MNITQLRAILHTVGIIQLPNLSDGWYALVKSDRAIGPYATPIIALMQLDAWQCHLAGFTVTHESATTL